LTDPRHGQEMNKEGPLAQVEEEGP